MPGKRDLKLKNVKPVFAETQKVSMSNALTRAAHNLLLSEKRLVMLGIANTDQMNQVTDNRGWKVRVHAAEYADKFGVDKHTAYDQLKSASKKIFHRYLHSAWNGKNGEEELYFRWVSSAKYQSMEGFVELNFTPEVVPHLIKLKSRFTSYKLETTSLFESIYAWRLYEVLLSYVNLRNSKKYSVEEFQELIEAPPSCCKNFGMLRRSVIEPAIKGINTHSDIKVAWEPVKKGRKVATINFNFQKNDQLKIDFNTTDKNRSPAKLTNKYIADNALPGESYQQAKDRLARTR